MSNTNASASQKTDWGFVDGAKPTTTAATSTEKPFESTEVVRVVASAVPPAPTLNIPKVEPSLGIIGQWQAGTLTRQAAVKQLSAVYDAKYDILKHTLKKAVEMKTAEADVQAMEYLKELDSEKLAILSKLNLKNKATRETHLNELHESTAARLREVREANWPERLKLDAYDRLFELNKRYADEMWAEVGT